MGNFSRYISEDDDRNEELEFEQYAPFDGAKFLQSVRNPAGAQMESAPTDPRQARRQDGLGAALAMKEEQGTKGQMPTLAPGDFGGSTNTAKRIQIAQWGLEDADEDRLTPEQVESGNKMLSSTDDQPVKPPGPDSPSTGYKEPSRYDKAKEAYDKEFGPGKKHKWYSMESTKDWQSRRASMQHDLVLDQRQEEEERRQAQTRQPYVIKTQEVKTQAGKKNVVGLWSDGSTNVMLEGLDDLAEKNDEYVDTVQHDAQGRAYKTKKGALDARFLTDEQAGLPLADTVNGGSALHGPTDPYVDRWVAPQKEQTRVLGRGSKWTREDGTVIGEGEPIPPSTGGGGAPKNPDVQARKDAEKEADELLKGNKEYEGASPEARKATRDMWIRKILEGNKSGGAAPAKPNQTVKYD